MGISPPWGAVELERCAQPLCSGHSCMRLALWAEYNQQQRNEVTMHPPAINCCNISPAVIDIHNAKWEMGLTTCADNFLLAIQAVSVGSIVLGRFCISARTGGSFSALTDPDNGPRSSAMRSLTSLIANSERSMPTHWRCTRSAVTKAVAHPRKWSRIRSPKLLDTLMMRYKSAIGFALDRPFPFVSAHHDSGTFPGWSGVLAWPEPNGPSL